MHYMVAASIKMYDKFRKILWVFRQLCVKGLIKKVAKINKYYFTKLGKVAFITALKLKKYSHHPNP